MRWDVAELMGGPGLGRQRKNVVPTPRLAHTARWLAGQTFGPEDDPDRIAVPLQLPDFVRAGPHSSRKFIGSRKIRKERVNFPPGAVKPGLMFCPSTPRGSFARMHHNVLSRRECAQLVDACNAKGFTPSLMNLGSGIQVYRPDMRSSYRCVSDSHALSSYLFEVRTGRPPPILLQLPLVYVIYYYILVGKCPMPFSGSALSLFRSEPCYTLITWEVSPTYLSIPTCPLVTAGRSLAGLVSLGDSCIFRFATCREATYVPPP